ncbi:MAG: Type I restriction-modification system, restriction subunit R [Candidatus Jettenia ecosi]|uniref:Type I restriction enzyme endonuclease subunit n=1 Tax=Candidatus Jettenia ecosi TaxID=2494326 RepID=A0A533QHE2_9BACT|nr:MAG: Type I restriction-modification system, restriction subunit R [Candidatus Jettenia ecosi]
MTTNKITESAIEQFAIELLEKSGYQYVYGPDIAPDGQMPERQSFEDVLLIERLTAAVARINPNVPADAREDAVKQLLRLNSSELISNNESFHRMLTEGVKVSYQKDDNSRGDLVWLIDFSAPENSDFLVLNQYTVIENHVNKRPDVVLFVNGLPLVIIELKNPADENATIHSAFQQIQTYKQAIPKLFAYNGFIVISDGLEARAGTISAAFSRFMAWKTADGKVEASPLIGQLETLIKGMLCRNTLLDLIRHFIVFERKAVQKQPSLGPSQGEGGHYRGGMYFMGMINQVRELRKNQTKAEEIFWELVRNKGFLGLKFRRQHQIGHYIVDFYCHSERLIIEFDGEVHNTSEQRKKDEKRDKYLKSLGNKVLRFSNTELIENTENVLKVIVESLSPLGRDGREGGITFGRDGREGGITFGRDGREGGITFGRDGREGGITTVITIKKLAAYHQYYAVNRAVESTLRASGFVATRFKEPDCPKVIESPENYRLPDAGTQPVGDRKGGVVWHTQGSGKSLSMVFYTGKIVLAMDNPTVLVITDRNDLDDQLFDTFASSKQLLRQEPVQAESREHLKELLKVASGGIVFTTIQKFQPDEGNVYERLSDRKNIIVIADEAHRTQYDFKAKTIDAKDKNGNVVGKRIVYGFAKYLRDALPNATYLGFTGTPIENTDVNTPAVFGNYVDVYDILQAVTDGATVRIYYESRLAKITLSEEGRKLISSFDETLSRPLPEGEEDACTWREEEDDSFSPSVRDKREGGREGLAKWTRLEALIGSADRIRQIAQDIVTHFEQRQEVFEGKGMVVTMSRRIAAELYTEIIKIRPQWHNDDLRKGAIKVVMTSASSDGPEISKHHTTKEQRRTLADRMKNPEDELKLVIVRDMWLTGFDVPCLHTLYIDKPMRGHNLMQAIARVNRVYKDKAGGLVVDYLGITADLKKALSFYSDSGGKGDPAVAQEKAVQLMLEKLEIVSQMFYGFAYEEYFEADTGRKLSLILAAEDHILGLENGKKRFIDEVTALSQAFSIAIPHEQAMDVKDEVAFFQVVKSRLVKFDSSSPFGRGGGEGLETAIRQVIDKALVTEQVIDVFDAAGIKKPDISILSEDFLLEVQNMKHKNIALEVLKKLLNDEIRARIKKNLIQGKSFMEMLEDSIKKYHNKILTAAEVIEELIKLSKEIREMDKEPQEMGMSDYEYAFYTAIANNESARQVMAKEKLRELAVVLFEKVRENTSIDWTIKESVKAKLKVIVKRILRQYGYPPDMQMLATETVLKQAELIADEIAHGK